MPFRNEGHVYTGRPHSTTLCPSSPWVAPAASFKYLPCSQALKKKTHTLMSYGERLQRDQSNFPTISLCSGHVTPPVYIHAFPWANSCPSPSSLSHHLRGRRHCIHLCRVMCTTIPPSPVLAVRRASVWHWSWLLDSVSILTFHDALILFGDQTANLSTICFC